MDVGPAMRESSDRSGTMASRLRTALAVALLALAGCGGPPPMEGIPAAFADAIAFAFAR
jgi:hypothetical protein